MNIAEGVASCMADASTFHQYAMSLCMHDKYCMRKGQEDAWVSEAIHTKYNSDRKAEPRTMLLQLSQVKIYYGSLLGRSGFEY